MDIRTSAFTLTSNNFVSTHNDWDQLQEIIVGTLGDANDPEIDTSLQSFFQPSNEERGKANIGPVDQKLADEMEEDLKGFVAVLENHGVTVRQAPAFDFSRQYENPFFATTGLNTLMPRDSFLVVGDTIIETPSCLKARWLDAYANRELFRSYFQSGANWLAAPHPELADDTFPELGKDRAKLGELEPIFDGANVLRLGTDLIYNVSNSGNRAGAAWLRRALRGQYDVHEVSLTDDHLGTTLLALRPGVILANPARLSLETIPSIIEDWEVIWAPTPEPQQVYVEDYARSSDWLGINVLSLNEKDVIVEEKQTAVQETLHKNGFNPIPVRFRHGRSFGGGFHCVTLDIRRDGTLKKYV